MTLKDNLHTERSTAFLMTEVDGEAVLMDTETDRLFVLEGAAGRVWSLLETPQPLSGLVAQLCSEYAVAPETCEREVRALLHRLADFGAVRLN